MAAALKFYAGGDSMPTEITGSGLGLYGAAGFNASVQVGQYQDKTFITDGTGSVDGGASTNCKYLTSSTVSVDGASSAALSGVGVGSGSLNVRFTFDEVVKTQNGELRIYNRDDEDVDPEGVTAQVSQLVNGGSGVSSSGTAKASHDGWLQLHGSGVIMDLLSSPGSGGLSPSGVDTQDTRHDWYVALSAKPDSIGSKTAFGLWVELEYL